MAHAGKLGPVIARRDFNLNVDNNNQGFYSGYFFRPTYGLTQGPGTAPNGTRFDCFPGLFVPPNMLRWVSIPKGFGLLSFFFRMTVELINGEEYKQYIEQFEVGVTGPILVWSPVQDGLRFPNWQITNGRRLISYNPAWFTTAPTFIIGTEVKVKTWFD